MRENEKQADDPVVVMEKFSSVRFSTLNLRTPNQTIRSVQQFSGTLNGTWRSGSKRVRFTFELHSNANVSWDPPAGACAPVWCGGSGQDLLVGVLWAILMDLQLRQGTGWHRHARGGGELACGRGEGCASHCRGAAGRAQVVAQGDHAYWQGISGEWGHMRRDALIVYRNGLVLKRFCHMWMTGSQMEWNIWMGRSACTGCGEAHALTTTTIKFNRFFIWYIGETNG